jgi:hypothetical protein
LTANTATDISVPLRRPSREEHDLLVPCHSTVVPAEIPPDLLASPLLPILRICSATIIDTVVVAAVDAGGRIGLASARAVVAILSDFALEG